MKNGIFRAFVIITIFIGLAFLMYYYNVAKYLTLDNLKENKFYLEQAVASNYIQTVVIYILLFAAVVGIALPGVPPLTLVGGFLFDFLPGGAYALIGATIGSSISFLLIRYVLSNLIRGKYAHRLDRFNKKIKSQGVASYLITMQLLGIFPYFIINTLASLAGVPFSTFFWTTFVGSIPMILIYSYAGRKLFLMQTMSEIFSPSIIILLFLLIFLVFAPVLLKRFHVITDLEES